MPLNTGLDHDALQPRMHRCWWCNSASPCPRPLRFAGLQVWQCSWSTTDEPATPYMPSILTGATTFFSASPSGQFMLLGSADGVVRLQPLQPPHEPPRGLRSDDPNACIIGPLAPYWEAPLHDMQHGAVVSMAMAYDETCLISAGHDGSLCVMVSGSGSGCAFLVV